MLDERRRESLSERGLHAYELPQAQAAYPRVRQDHRAHRREIWSAFAACRRAQATS